jgi:hypothetical protein
MLHGRHIAAMPLIKSILAMPTWRRRDMAVQQQRRSAGGVGCTRRTCVVPGGERKGTVLTGHALCM